MNRHVKFFFYLPYIFRGSTALTIETQHASIKKVLTSDPLNLAPIRPEFAQYIL
jgi:hypothetical protein